MIDYEPKGDKSEPETLRNFDIDIMHVLDKEVIHEDDFEEAFLKLLCNEEIQNKEDSFEIRVENAKEKWKSPVSCKHLDEPWIFHQMKDETKFPTEHVGLTRPTCTKCFGWSSEFYNLVFQKHLDHEGRKMKLISPTSLTLRGLKRL